MYFNIFTFVSVQFQYFSFVRVPRFTRHTYVKSLSSVIRAAKTADFYSICASCCRRLTFSQSARIHCYFRSLTSVSSLRRPQLLHSSSSALPPWLYLLQFTLCPTSSAYSPTPRQHSTPTSNNCSALGALHFRREQRHLPRHHTYRLSYSHNSASPGLFTWLPGTFFAQRLLPRKHLHRRPVPSSQPLRNYFEHSLHPLPGPVNPLEYCAHFCCAPRPHNKP